MKTLNWSFEAMGSSVKAHSRIFPLTSILPAQKPAVRCQAFSLTSADAPLVSLRESTGVPLAQRSSSSGLRTPEDAFIYVVDNEMRLTELYDLFLKGAGYRVRTFNDRTEALATLAVEQQRPDLLIMDYLGDSMPVNRFIHRCLDIHQSLPVLIASGLSECAVRLACVKPIRFIQKPFTASEFLLEVRSVLLGR